MKPFPAQEVLQMAVRIEENGAAFYEKAARLVRDPAAEKLLLALANAEREHRAYFRFLLDDMNALEREMPFSPEDGDNAAYLASLADAQVFPAQDPAGLLTGSETPVRIIEMALGAEKDSIVFYLSMKEAVPSPKGRERLDTIIREELSHIRTLEKARRSFK